MTPEMEEMRSTLVGERMEYEARIEELERELAQAEAALADYRREIRNYRREAAQLRGRGVSGE